MHNLEWEKLRLSPQTKFFKHCHILNSGLACSTRRWFLLACISHFKVTISSSLPISFLFWSSSCSKNTLSEKQWTIYYSLDKTFGSLSLHWINIDLKMKKNVMVLLLTLLLSLILFSTIQKFWSFYNLHLFLVKLLTLFTYWRCFKALTTGICFLSNSWSYLHSEDGISQCYVLCRSSHVLELKQFLGAHFPKLSYCLCALITSVQPFFPQ